MNVAIIGGGISGLATAFALKRSGIDVIVFESSNRLGGNIQTIEDSGYLLESGPNSLLANRSILDLVRDLNLESQMEAPNKNAKTRFIVRNGRLTPLPSRLIGLANTRAFTPSGKLRMIAEPFIGRSDMEDESVAGFFRRRFGRELVDRGVDPFISGIYAGDPEKLSMRAAFPRIYEYERQFRSVTLGSLFSTVDENAKLPKGTSRSFSFRRGMRTLIETLAKALDHRIQLDSHVTAITPNDGGGYNIATTKGDFFSNAVVISTPADIAAKLLLPADPSLAALLSDVYYPPIAVVYLGYEKRLVKTEPIGFGVLVPGVEKMGILGSLFSSSVFEGRAPVEYHLFTTFIGGSRNAELLGMTDKELAEIAAADLGALFDIDGQPSFLRIKRWPRSIPQYNIGYEKLTVAIDRFRVSNPGTFFCSNFYRGISVGDCAKNAVATAQDVQKYLND